MKNSLQWLVFLALLSFTFILVPGESPRKIESQLSKAQGKERISLLAGLTKTYCIESPQKALEYGKEALELLEKFPDKKLHVNVLNNMSHAYRFLGDNRNARKSALEGRAIANDIKYKSGDADSLYSLGKIYMQMGEMDQAMVYFSDSKQLYIELNDQDSLAHTFTAISSIYWEKGDYAKALEYNFESLNIYEGLKDERGIGRMHANIGIIYGELSNRKKSLEHYKKALKILEKLNEKSAVAMTLNNMGFAYREERDYKKALDKFYEALEITEELGDKITTAIIYNSIGYVRREMKDYMLALNYLNRSLKLKEEFEDQAGIADVSINIASVKQRLGNFKEAIQLANDGLKIAKKLNLQGEISDGYQVLAETYEAMGDHQKALSYYKMYKETNDEIFNDETTKKIAGLQTDFEIKSRENKIELLRKDRKTQTIILIFFILLALLIGLLAFVIYTRYRLKVRVTRALKKEIDERIQIEQKLRESEEKYRILAEKSMVGIKGK
ncbi:MAG: tetratricopeptide repeat protein, partial [Candidatus Aminicenantes bacterium]